MPPPHPELARPYFTRQAQYGRRVIFSWSPADSALANPLTVPWPLVEELIEGVEFVSEQAASSFDLAGVSGISGRTHGDDVTSWGPYFSFLSWEAAKRWLYDQAGANA